MNFASTVTGTAPTGDKTNGFSTGHATIDWSNYFEHSLSRLTPFFYVGIANAASDTMSFIRPYTTYGVVTHAGGGARYRLVRGLSVGVSGFAIEPSGQQTVVSRLVRRSGNGTTPEARPRHEAGTEFSRPRASPRVRPIWPGTTILYLAANGSGDRRQSVWRLHARAHFALNTVFFGISFNLGKAVRSLGI